MFTLCLCWFSPGSPGCVCEVTWELYLLLSVGVCERVKACAMMKCPLVQGDTLLSPHDRWGGEGLRLTPATPSAGTSGHLYDCMLLEPQSSGQNNRL